MARRKKNMTYEEELTYLDSEISKTEETLKALKTRKKELAKVKEQADLQTLYAAIKESGKSVANVISSLKSEYAQTANPQFGIGEQAVNTCSLFFYRIGNFLSIR